jgi:hypothetical protein
MDSRSHTVTKKRPHQDALNSLINWLLVQPGKAGIVTSKRLDHQINTNISLFNSCDLIALIATIFTTTKAQQVETPEEFKFTTLVRRQSTSRTSMMKFETCYRSAI